MTENNTLETIAIIGGTGQEGKGLAYRWIKAGYPVIIGSRKAEKAHQAIDELGERLSGEQKMLLSGKENAEAVKAAQVAVLTVPYQFHRDILTSLKEVLAGKFLLDVTVPLVPPKVTTVHVPVEGSAALAAQKIVGDECRVLAAFQNISFELLLSDEDIECDVLVTGVDKESRLLGIRLVRAAGLQAWNAGTLENSIVAEGFTSILIRINKQNKTKSAGLRITGVPRD